MTHRWGHTGKHMHALKMWDRDICSLTWKESQDIFELKKWVTKQYVYHI